MRHLIRAVLIAATVQLPFLVLMNVAGVHSALGGVWVVFYIPAILVLYKTGLPEPGLSPFLATLQICVIQEIILVGFIVTFMALYRHFRLQRKTSS